MTDAPAYTAPPGTLGFRLAALRAERDLTQDQVAAAVGVTRQYYNQLENDTKQVTTLALLGALARVHKITGWELLADLPRATGPQDNLVNAAPHLREGLLGLLDQDAPVAAVHLPAHADALRRARMDCDYKTLGVFGPQVLSRAVRHDYLTETPEGARLLADVTVTLSLAVRPLGLLDLAQRLAEVAVVKARHCGDPATIGMATFAASQCAVANATGGMYQHGYTLVADALAILDVGTGPRRLAPEVAGMLHLQAALASAGLGDHDRAADHLDVAQAGAPATTDPRASWRMDYNKTNVGVWRVAVLNEQGEDAGDRAARLAAHLNPDNLATTQRQVHLLLHRATAEYHAGRTDQAVELIAQAEHRAPGEVRGRRSRINSIIGGALTRARRKAGSQTLRELARRLGVDPLAGTY